MSASSNSPNSVFHGVYRVQGKLATLNLTPGRRVYDEQLIQSPGGEYRLWNPFRSKLAAAIQNGLKSLPITPGSSVLYLGASTGTTPSHVSDILGRDGLVFCVEFAKRSMMDLVQVCESRPNMVPLLADARMPHAYAQAIKDEAGGLVDVIYEDVADAEQVRILVSNAKAFLKPGGYAMLAVKARSIDALASPPQIFKKVEAEIDPYFQVLQELALEPFDKDHLFLLLKLK